MKLLKEFKNSNKLEEKVVDITTSDFKIGPSGRKARAHRFKVGEKPSINANVANTMATTATSPNMSNFNQSYPITEVLANAEPDPPFVLLLKRTAIRLYPNEMRVALYYNKQLDKHFSVPYGLKGSSGAIQAEEIEPIEESVMDQLHKIVDNKSAQRVKFASGETRKVDHFTASAITQVHKALNDENKKKFSDMVHKSPQHLMKAADFAFKHVK